MYGIKQDSIKNQEVLKGRKPVLENQARVPQNGQLWLPPVTVGASYGGNSKHEEQLVWQEEVTPNLPLQIAGK